VVRALASRRPALQVARSVMAVTQNSLVIAALAHMPLADVMAIMQASPLLATALAVPLLGERVGLARWLMVGAGFLGVVVILRPGLGVLDPWALAALPASGLFAGYQLLTRRVAAHDPWQTTFLMTALPAALLSSLALPFVWHMPADALAWGAFLAAGGCASIGHYLMIKALQTTEAAALQPFNYTVLLWAAVFGALLFGEWPDVATLVGAALIVGSGLLAFRPARRPL
jgi:drug/metabolite transporter (DMT)-like permease